MRINDLANNMNNGKGTGINNDLSLIEGADSEKNRTTALLGGDKGAVGFFKTKGNEASGLRKTGFDSSFRTSINPSSTVDRSMSSTYTLNEAKGLNEKNDGLAAKILNNLDVKQNNDKELVKNLTGDDYEFLSDEGMSIEKFGKERLEKAIERIKENRETRELRLAEGVEKQQELRDAVERMAIYSSLDSGSDKLIAKMLYEADIPVTEENIESVKQATEMAGASGKISDSSESFLIKNALPPTIDNIYKASYVGEMRLVKLDDEAWESLKNNAMSIVREAGEGESEGLENARWLVEHDIPVTTDNLLYKSELDTLRKNLPEEEQIYNSAISAMQAGDDAQDGLLINRTDEKEIELLGKIDDVVKNISVINEQGIYTVCAQKGEVENIIIPELIEASRHTNDLDFPDASIIQTGTSVKISDTAAATKILLEEVRLSLNIEAGRRLMSKGIDIMSDGLTRVAEGIRELEREYYKNIYKEIEADYGKTGEIDEAAADAASKLAADTEKDLRLIANAPLELYKASFSVRHTVTLAELSETGELVIKESVSSSSGTVCINPSSMKSALEFYEGSSTEVRRDLGDSIKKAFSGSVDMLISSNGLDITEGNRRAVRILGYNGMEITADNIERIKHFDAKVTGLIEKMTPTVVMTMIRDGINPLESTIDELDSKVTSILNEQGMSLEQKYSEFLVKMEETNSITQNERNAYIGIYRLLYNVEKNDGAAIGSLINSGRELTFRNLMTEARTMNKDVDLTAADDTEIRNSHFSNSVTLQIDEAFIYQRELVRDTLKVTEPSAWDRALSGKDYASTTIEELHDGLFADNSAGSMISGKNNYAEAGGLAENTYDRSYMTGMDTNARASEIVQVMIADNSASNFLNSFGITDSFENRKAFGDILNNPDKEDSAVNISSDELNGCLDSFSKFDELLGIKTRMANTLTGQAFRTAITAQAAAELNGRVERIGMLKKLAGKGHFRLNINDGDEPKQVNLTMIGNSGNSGTISIEVKKPDYTVQADLNMVIMENDYNSPSVSKGMVRWSGDMTGKSADIAGQVKKSLKDYGIDADNINIMQGTRDSDAYVSYLAQHAGIKKQNDSEKSGIQNADVLLKAAGAFLNAFV